MGSKITLFGQNDCIGRQFRTGQGCLLLNNVNRIDTVSYTEVQLFDMKGNAPMCVFAGKLLAWMTFSGLVPIFTNSMVVLNCIVITT